MRAIKVTTEGVVSVVDLAEPIWSSVNDEIGGFEIVRPKYNNFPDGLVILVDDNGLAKSLPINMVGTHFYDPDMKASRGLVGDILIIAEGMTEDGADFVEMPEDLLVDMIMSMTILYISYRYDGKCGLTSIEGKGLCFATHDPEAADEILTLLEEARESVNELKKVEGVPSNVIPLKRRN